MSRRKKEHLVKEVPPSHLLKVAKVVWAEKEWYNKNDYYAEVAKRVMDNPEYLIGNEERSFLKQMLLTVTWRDKY